MKRVLLIAMGLVMLACGAEEGSRASVQRKGEQATLVRSSDPDLAEMAAEMLPNLAQRSGLELREPVRVERRSRAELERYLRAQLDEELPPSEAEKIARSYYLLGLVPEEMDLRALLLEVYTEQVAGFYEPDSTALFVLDDQPPESLSTVLIHELVHAVQDQTTDLSAITARDRGNDRQTAAHSAIEGHATLVMMEYLLEMAQGAPVDLSQLPELSELLGSTLASVEKQYPALAGAPRIFRESLLFPYLHGAGFVQALWSIEGEREAPFGPFMPQSTEQVMEPTLLLGEAAQPPLEISLAPEAASPRALTYSNSLGMFEVGILLEEHLGSGSGALSRGWAGDRFALLQDGDGSSSLAWVVVWDDGASRDRFASAWEGALERFPLTAEVIALDVDGVPGVLLRIGNTGGVEAAVSANDDGGVS